MEELEEVLEKARKVAQAAEVYYVHHRDEPVLFEANRIKLLESRESSGIALRVIKGGRIGLSSTTNQKDVDNLIDNALDTLPFGPEARLEFPSHSNFPKVEVYDSNTETLSQEDMIHLGQTLIDQVRSYNPELVCDASVARGITTLTIMNSRGGHASYTKSSFSVHIEGTIVKGTDMLFVGDGKSSCRPVLDTAEIVESVRNQLEYSKKIVAAPTGQVSVIFTPRGTAGTLLSPLLVGFNGKTVLQGASPLVGKLGAQLLDEKFNLWDDPTIPYAPGSRMCDDEGIPTRKIPLVDKGVISNFLYDLQTAAMAGVESTASAHRGLSTLPSPGASVIIIGEGDASYHDMVADVKDGLVVESLLGAGQSNVLGGDFNANVLLGFKVENGKITGRVKNTVISGNVYRVLKEIHALEREAHWVRGWIKTPALYSRSVSVATKG